MMMNYSSPQLMLSSDRSEVREAIHNNLHTSRATSPMDISDSSANNNNNEERQKEDEEEISSDPSSGDDGSESGSGSPLHQATLSPQARTSTPDLLTFRRNHLLLPDPDAWWDELFGWAPDEDDLRPPPSQSPVVETSNPFSSSVSASPTRTNKRTISQTWTACNSNPSSPGSGRNITPVFGVEFQPSESDKENRDPTQLTPTKTGTKPGFQRSESDKENRDPDCLQSHPQLDSAAVPFSNDDDPISFLKGVTDEVALLHWCTPLYTYIENQSPNQAKQRSTTVLQKARAQTPKKSPQGKLPLPVAGIPLSSGSPEKRRQTKKDANGSSSKHETGTGIENLSPAVDIYRKYPHQNRYRPRPPKRTRCVSYFDDDIFGFGPGPAGTLNDGMDQSIVESERERGNERGRRDTGGGEDGGVAIWDDGCDDGGQGARVEIADANANANAKAESKTVLGESRGNRLEQYHHHQRRQGSRLPRPSFSGSGRRV